MKPVFKNPSAKCSTLINRYIFIGSDKNNLCDRFVPDGSISIVFNFLGNVTLLINGKETTLPEYFIVTPNIDSLRIKTTAPYDTMVVNCKATVFTRLFNISMDQFQRGSYKELDLFSGYPLLEKLKAKKNYDARIKFLEEYLRTNVLPDKYEYDYVDLVYNDIISNGCPGHVQEIMDKYEVNPRTFRRKFLKRTGISTKTIARIVRVNYIWDHILSSPGSDLYNIIYDCKFFDQAHFIKDFKKIIGETPQSFFKRDLHEVEILSGKLI